MTKFIKLTEVYVNGQTMPVILNCENILSVKRSDRTDTHVMMKNNKYFFVKEKPDAIWEMLIVDNTRPPIIMNAEEALKFYKARDGV